MSGEMTPGELADRLDVLKSMRDLAGSSESLIRACRGGIGEMSELHLDLILKSLHVAADMEVLRKDGLPIYIYPQTNGSVYLNYNGCDYHGSDIHSAARVAVEELKGRV